MAAAHPDDYAALMAALRGSGVTIAKPKAVRADQVTYPHDPLWKPLAGAPL